MNGDGEKEIHTAEGGFVQIQENTKKCVIFKHTADFIDKIVLWW
jgi:hypothetical protein